MVVCVINCNCSRVCPCLCGDEAAIVRAELQAMDRRTVGKHEEGEAEDIQGLVGGKDGVLDEIGIATVGGRRRREGRRETRRREEEG